ncbi:MAG TPA: isoprenylcysteine carboxylmethyltransferase family protein [Candidatus Acidoferrum sp.]|nr:isoprenylcysteine carboxylmethyltransferase family protein [Candidatus Acidoferrum sp.]
MSRSERHEAPGAFFMRWRVRFGYPLAAAVLWFSRPAARSILLGALVGAPGLWIRAYAAGCLRKQEVLTVTGPYAYTRNPLYLGSAVLAFGAAIATWSWVSAILLLLYFAVFYSMVMRREEKELHLRHGTAFEEYADAVPLFFPRWQPAKLAAAPAGSFSWGQYKKNHEWQAALGFLLLIAALILIWHFRQH